MFFIGLCIAHGSACVKKFWLAFAMLLAAVILVAYRNRILWLVLPLGLAAAWPSCGYMRWGKS